MSLADGRVAALCRMLARTGAETEAELGLKSQENLPLWGEISLFRAEKVLMGEAGLEPA